jgi:hypothetical protein
MDGHPARQLARMAADAAGELRGYTDPADPFPWELTEDDHRVILPRLHHAIADLAVCIDGIAQATGDEHAKQQLTEGIRRLLSGCAHLSAASAALSAPGAGPDAEPVITTQSAYLPAADFPAVMTADLLQAATRPPRPETAQPAAALAAEDFPQQPGGIPLTADSNLTSPAKAAGQRDARRSSRARHA